MGPGYRPWRPWCGLWRPFRSPWCRTVVVGVWTSVRTLTGAVWSGIRAVIAGVLAAVAAVVQGATALIAQVRSWWAAAQTAISRPLTTAVGFAKGVPGRIIGGLATIGDRLATAMGSIISGLVRGLGSGDVGAAVRAVIAAARQLLPFSPAKEGPFSGRGWTLYSGQSIPLALAEGITQAGDKPIAAVRAVTEQTRMAVEFVGQQTPRAALREEAATIRASADPIHLQMDAADLAACHTVEDFIDLIDRRVKAL